MFGSNPVDGVADIDGETANHALERGIGQRHDGQPIRRVDEPFVAIGPVPLQRPRCLRRARRFGVDQNGTAEAEFPAPSLCLFARQWSTSASTCSEMLRLIRVIWNQRLTCMQHSGRNR